MENFTRNVETRTKHRTDPSILKVENSRNSKRRPTMTTIRHCTVRNIARTRAQNRIRTKPREKAASPDRDRMVTYICRGEEEARHKTYSGRRTARRRARLAALAVSIACAVSDSDRGEAGGIRIPGYIYIRVRVRINIYPRECSSVSPSRTRARRELWCGDRGTPSIGVPERFAPCGADDDGGRG